MDMPVNNQSQPPVVNSTSPVSGQAAAPTSAQVKGQVHKLAADATDTLAKANDPSLTEEDAKQLLSTTSKLNSKSVDLQEDIDNLVSSNGAPKVEIDSLQQTLTAANQTLNTANSVLNAQIFSNNSAALANPNAVPSFSTVAITTPPPTLPGTQSPSVEVQRNMFLAPSLATLIFQIMQTVAKQKNENIEIDRKFMEKYISYQWSFAQSSAEATLNAGMADAAAMRANATGQIVAGALSIGFGVASIGTSMYKMKSINDAFDVKEAELLNKKKTTPDMADTEYQKQLNDLQSARAHKLSSFAQLDPTIRVLDMLGHSSSSFAIGAAGIVASGYKVEEAQQNYIKAMYQQAEQSAQAIVQLLQGNIQDNTQATQQFLQAVDNILQSQTRQA